MRVLAIGATGQFAGLVVPALVSKGLRVRALVHDPAKADRVRELGADEAVAGDLRDRASIDVAAIAFATDDLVGGTFELAAGGMLTRIEIATMMSPHAGRPIVARDIEPDMALARLPAGEMRDGLSAMFADYTAHGFHGGNNLVLRSILARAPRTLDSYLGELAE